MASSSHVINRPGLPKFVAWLLLRASLMVVTAAALGTMLGDSTLFFNQVILTLVFAGQIAEFIHFINKTNRELSRLLNAIQYSDFTISFDRSTMGGSFTDLAQSLTGVALKLRDVKIEKEGQYQFLQKMVDQMEIGVMVLRNEQVMLINPSAQELLGAKGITNWNLLEEKNRVFTQQVKDLGQSGRKLMEFSVDGVTRMMIVKVGTITILDNDHRIVTIQDINSEIEQKEIEAWHKLINILTHEIMNSITPISSLTETMQTILRHRDGQPKKAQELTTENVNDLLFSLSTIHRRSEALQQFVENYRKITRVPRPEKKDLSAFALFASVERLMHVPLTQSRITVTLESNIDTTIKADATLVEQVLINLVTNSIHAMEDASNKEIKFRTFVAGSQTVIEVEDNGKGIPEKEIKQIFIPFFTTRENGSGIGLSLSRQIMSSHGGTIRVRSEVNKGTVFSLFFPAS